MQVLYGHAIFKIQVYSWNTCAQIFPDGEFFQITPMMSKYEAGTTIDKMNWYGVVVNEIFMDNAYGKTGYNT